jgi:hypothetical protein
MSSNSRINRSTLLRSITLLIPGVQKHFASASFIFGATSYTGPTIVSALQTVADVINATDPAKAAYQAALSAEELALENAKPLLSGLHQVIYGQFGTSVAILADFGLAPHKTATLTPEQKAAATAKAKATRAARHTMGSKQKQAIKGVVTTPATPASPAPAASGSGTGTPPVTA